MARHGVEAASGAAAALPPDIPGWDPQDLNTAPRIVMDTIQHLRVGEDDAQDRTWVHRRMAILAGQKKSPLDESVEIDPLTIYSSGDRISYGDAAAIIEDYQVFERVMKICSCKPLVIGLVFTNMSWNCLRTKPENSTSRLICGRR